MLRQKHSFEWISCRWRWNHCQSIRIHRCCSRFDRYNIYHLERIAQKCKSLVLCSWLAILSTRCQLSRISRQPPTARSIECLIDGCSSLLELKPIARRQSFLDYWNDEKVKIFVKFNPFQRKNMHRIKIPINCRQRYFVFSPSFFFKGVVDDVIIIRKWVNDDPSKQKSRFFLFCSGQ